MLYTGEEMAALRKRFGPIRHERVEQEINPIDNEFWEPMQARANRRGEVVPVLQSEAGHVLLHTKSFYPQGVYRLPSGGIKAGEPVLAALLRETAEETSLVVAIDRMLGLIEYHFCRGDQETSFASWLFLVRPLSADPPENQDTEERITDFRWVPAADLRDVAAQLRQLQPAWHDWGRFRAVAHDMAADALGV